MELPCLGQRLYTKLVTEVASLGVRPHQHPIGILPAGVAIEDAACDLNRLVVLALVQLQSGQRTRRLEKQLAEPLALQAGPVLLHLLGKEIIHVERQGHPKRPERAQPST